MPCDMINYYSVEFQAKNLNLLTKTVEEAGGTIRQIGNTIHITNMDGTQIDIANGQAISTSQQAINDLKVAYARTVVTEANRWAQAKGWQVQKTSDNKMRVFKNR